MLQADAAHAANELHALPAVRGECAGAVRPQREGHRPAGHLRLRARNHPGVRPVHPGEREGLSVLLPQVFY